MAEVDIKAVIGLGNPGSRFEYTRHNIGFRVLDEIAQRYGAQWRDRDMMELAEVQIAGKKILLIKPQTFMNESGRVIPFLSKQGIKAENIMVVHDELEKPFGSISVRVGGSAHGHNGLRSIIEQCGADFARLRFGIGRPGGNLKVGDFVLQNFGPEEHVDEHISTAASEVERVISN